MRLRKRTCSPGPCHKYQQAFYEILWYSSYGAPLKLISCSGPSCTSIEMSSVSHAARVYDSRRYDTELKCNSPLF